MAPVALTFVVSFSSQDERHPVGNLISGEGFKKWLSAPQMKAGQIEAVFQLEASSVITHIDVGSVWCANIEIEVGRSSWPQTTRYRTLVATANLMSPMDSRNGNAVVRTRMFNSNDFLKDTCSEEYDRIRVICRQTFRKDVQFGLSFIRIKGNFRRIENNLTENHNQTVKNSPKEKNNNGRISSSPLTPKTGSASNLELHDQTKLCQKSPCTPRSAELKNRLLKIDGTSECGISNEQSLSRSAKLVLASANRSTERTNTTPHKAHLKSLFVSNSLHNKTAIPFELEVKKFLSRLQIDKDDLSTMTLSDLRHRLERRKHRKLTPEEKKKFIQLTEDFLRRKFENVPVEEISKKMDNDIHFEEVIIDLCADEELPDLSILNEITENISAQEAKAPSCAFVDFKSIGNAHKNNSTSENFGALKDISTKNSLGFTSYETAETISDAKTDVSKTKNVELNMGSKRLFKRGKSFSSDVGIESPSNKSHLQSKLIKAVSTCREDQSNSDHQKVITEQVADSNLSASHQRQIVSSPFMSRGNEAVNSPKLKSAKKRSRKSDDHMKSTSSKKLYSGEITGLTKNNKIGEDVLGSSIACTDCNKMVPRSNYLIHQARCKHVSKPESNIDVAQNALSLESSVHTRKGKSLLSSGSRSTEMDIEYCVPVDKESSSLIACPICSEYFTPESVNTHANVCAEMSLLA